MDLFDDFQNFHRCEGKGNLRVGGSGEGRGEEGSLADGAVPQESVHVRVREHSMGSGLTQKTRILCSSNFIP